MERRITILGMGASATERRHDIARYCEGTEIWGLNNGYITFPRLAQGKAFSRFFELHSWRYLSTWKPGTDRDGNQINHFAALDALGCPVYVGQPMPLLANQKLVDWTAFGHYWNGKLFGRLSAVSDTGTDRLAVFTMGSPSIMLSLALWEHDTGQEVEYIQSWGIDTSDPQHVTQRASWSFWLSQALARGISIGGTAAGFMFAHENDEGLHGLRELITANVNKQEQLQ